MVRLYTCLQELLRLDQAIFFSPLNQLPGMKTAENMDPLVSICMSTFEHEAFIGQAIESVITQITNFSFQLVIGEDSSGDRTRAICEEYEKKYRSKILLLPSDRNYGQNNNLFRILQACTGKYIALCEGDDYWTDPSKLQKQVNFLEDHPDYILCFHKINTVDGHNNVLEATRSNSSVAFYKGKDIFHLFIPTLSLVFRNCLVFFPEEFFRVKSTDAFMFGMLAGFGDAANLGFVGANYRKHNGGLYNQLKMVDKYKQSIHTRKLMKRSSYFSNEQRKEIKRELIRRKILYMKIFLKKREPINCLRIVLF